jgi:uncharacterized protein YydD (DUF2326 family)
MSQLTINQLLCLTKAVRARLNELNALRTLVATRERFFGQTEKVTEPQYDVKAVDIKCVELENFLFEADSVVKQSNAVTKVEIDAEQNSLLAPLM